MESMPRSDEMRCLFCDGKMPLHRKIANGQFCSTAHRKEYWKEQERLAVERLSQTDQTLRATFAELHATLDEQAARPVNHLNVEPAPFPGTSATRKKQIPRKKLSIEQEELARKSSNRGQVVRAGFLILEPPDGSAWSAFVPVSAPLSFLIPDFAASSLQAMSLRFRPVAFDAVNTFGSSRCRVNAAGPVKLSNAAPSLDESAGAAPATSTAAPTALEPSVPPVVHDLVFRFAPEEPEVLRASAEIFALASAVEAESQVPPAASFVPAAFFVHQTSIVEPASVEPALIEPASIEPAPVAKASLNLSPILAPVDAAIDAAIDPIDEPALAASAAMKKIAPADSAHAARVEIVPVETPALGIAPVEFVPVRKALAPPVGQPAPMFVPMFKAFAACASSASASTSIGAVAWMPPAALPFHDLAPFGEAEPLCVPPMARLLRLPKLPAAAVSPQPEQRNVAALGQAGSLMLGAHSPRAAAPKLRYANAARYPLSAPASAPLQETVEPADPHSFDVAMPELKLQAVPSIESPDWGWLMPLSFAGEPLAGNTGSCIAAASLVTAFPDAREPNLPASRLEVVPDSEFKAPPRSLRMFAHWALPGDPSGRNPWAYATDFLSHAPRDLKLALFVIPVLLAMALHPRMPKLHVAAPTAAASTERNHTFQNVLAKQWDTMQQNVAARAAVALTDDFRSGLDDWQMRSDNAAAWSFDSNGFVRPGSLALYRPSMGLTDYQLRFLGLIDKKALSFVTRAQDYKNYYVIKLVILKPGPLPTVGVTRYAVIDGKAEGRADVVAPINAMPDMLYRVDLDIHDDTYLLSLQGQIVDTWTEPRLTHGGIGFFTARGEQSRVRWVQLTHQYDMLGRLCAYLAPFNIPNTNGRW
jgi:hypothetical protein